MAGVAAGHDAETGDSGEAARPRAELRGKRELEGARHSEGVNRRLTDAAEVESLGCTVQQPLGDVLVEGCDADRELAAGERLALIVGELLVGALVSHRADSRRRRTTPCPRAGSPRPCDAPRRAAARPAAGPDGGARG